MRMYFNETNSPSTEQRRLSVEACMIAAVATGAKSQYELRRFVQTQPGFEWVPTPLIAETANRLRHRKRLAMCWVEGKSIHAYRLPADPLIPLVRFSLQTNSPREIDRRQESTVLSSLALPRWFHVPTDKELLPYTDG